MEIRLIFPNNEDPPLAVGRLFSVFHGTKVDWRAAKPYKDAGVLIFSDDVPGVLYKTKTGYTLRIGAKTNENYDD